jgi:hypothetical protein
MRGIEPPIARGRAGSGSILWKRRAVLIRTLPKIAGDLEGGGFDFGQRQDRPKGKEVSLSSTEAAGPL